MRLVSDIHERACDLRVMLPIGAKRRQRLERIYRARLLFVHVPKTAGMSISAALYGDQVKHASIRFYQAAMPASIDAIPSFAVLRDPIERFLSAYRYARAGGSTNNDVAEPFRDHYLGFRAIDDALDHIEAATSPYAVDHIFRAQHWYVTDRAGRIAVDRLIAMEDVARLPSLVPGFPNRALPELNRSCSSDEDRLTRAQSARLRRLYPRDFALWEAMTVTARPALPVDRPAEVARAHDWATPLLAT